MQHPGEDDLILRYYGEHPEAEALDGHLGVCRACRAEYEALAAALGAADDPAPERGPEYPAQVWRRLEPRLGRPRQPVRWRVRAAAAAAMVILALSIGRIVPRRQAERGADWAQVRQRILLADVSEHLDRAEVLLTEAAHTPQADAWPGEFAEDLIESNRLYRQAAAQTGESAVASVLEEVERALLEIAHHNGPLEGVDLDDIVFKVRATASQVRARELEADRERSRS